MTDRFKKVELHCHLEGAAPPALTQSQARKYGIDTSGFLKDGAYVWRDFAEFIACYDRVAAVFAQGHRDPCSRLDRAIGRNHDTV